MPEEPQGIVAPAPLSFEAARGLVLRNQGQTQPPRRRGADYYDTILWRLLPVNQGDSDRGFATGLTSCGLRSGVSTVAANIAIRAADHRVGPVLLIDANFPRPRLDRVFRLRGAEGLGDVLSGRCDLQDAMHDTTIADLTVMPAGARGAAERLSLDQQRADALLSEVMDQYRLVVFDLPECSQMRHTLLFARRLDAALLVLRSEAVRRKHARQAMELLERDGVNVVGAVLTQQKNYVPRWFQRWL